jgi:hypothetical protein
MVSIMAAVSTSETPVNFYQTTKQYTDFNFQSPSMFAFYFTFFHKNYLTRSCSSFTDLSAYETTWSQVDWCTFCIHLRSLNVCNFGIVQAMGLKVRRRGCLQWLDPTTNLHYKTTK